MTDAQEFFIKVSRLIRKDTIEDMQKHIPTMEADLSHIASQHKIGVATMKL